MHFARFQLLDVLDQQNLLIARASSTNIILQPRAPAAPPTSTLERPVPPAVSPSMTTELIFNATVNTVAAMTGLAHDPHFAETDHPSDLGNLVRDLIDEGKAVAQAAGVELWEDPWEMNVLATQRGSAHYPSMLEDVEAGRQTEVELINGALVREAERVGVDAPLQAALYALVRGREAS